ncbi:MULTISPECIES: ThuA domain-containing protein [Chitinophaga]|uniref:ThuA domain-containing protein n=1 Tax=Chitinophaga TaxID=79328 RepID=UPI001CED3589|nr:MULTISPECIES: ThuA domain-containing protein [Chitinophaga]
MISVFFRSNLILINSRQPLYQRAVAALACLLLLLLPCRMQAGTAPAFKVLALSENGGHHVQFSAAAKVWLNKLAQEQHFTVDYITDTHLIDDQYLSQYRLFLQLDYPPYAWETKAVAAFERYIDQGRGGWVGLHHATLLGEFDGYPLWNWFHRFMGQIRFKDYIANFASGEVVVEDSVHPVMKGIPKTFTIPKEEWYTYDRSPRMQVHVLAHVDERTYQPPSNKKMGDHPVIWTNPHYAARNVYIFIGHDPGLLQLPVYTALLRNAILWASGK